MATALCVYGRPEDAMRVYAVWNHDRSTERPINQYVGNGRFPNASQMNQVMQYVNHEYYEPWVEEMIDATKELIEKNGTEGFLLPYDREEAPNGHLGRDLDTKSNGFHLDWSMPDGSHLEATLLVLGDVYGEDYEIVPLNPMETTHFFAETGIDPVKGQFFFEQAKEQEADAPKVYVVNHVYIQSGDFDAADLVEEPVLITPNKEQAEAFVERYSAPVVNEYGEEEEDMNFEIVERPLGVLFMDKEDFEWSTGRSFHEAKDFVEKTGEESVEEDPDVGEEPDVGDDEGEEH